MRAVRVQAYGGPDVLRVDEIEVPNPAAGEVLVRIEAAGVNFIDVYHRTGLYKGNLPFTPGMEGCGRIEAVGPGVTRFQVGDRVAYAMVLGAYAEYAVVPADRLVPVPDEVSPQEAAAAMLQGMTAHFLSESVFPLKPGTTCLIHAAAGGVGRLLVQMAKRKGATVFATVSTEAKAERVREVGADHVILYTETDFAARVKELTQGELLDVVYDSVGAATFTQSLACLRPRGLMVLYGQSSGPVAPVDPQLLNSGGSLYLTRPSLAHYTSDRAELLARANDVFTGIRRGDLRLSIDRVLPLSDVAEAHRLLEGRKTMGKIVLVP